MERWQCLRTSNMQNIIEECTALKEDINFLKQKMLTWRLMHTSIKVKWFFKILVLYIYTHSGAICQEETQILIKKLKA